MKRFENTTPSIGSAGYEANQLTTPLRKPF